MTRILKGGIDSAVIDFFYMKLYNTVDNFYQQYFYAYKG